MGITNNSLVVTGLTALVFARVSVDAQLKGFFVSESGEQIYSHDDVSFVTITIGSTAKSLVELWQDAYPGKTWPSGAVGFEGSLSADVYVGKGAESGAADPGYRTNMAPAAGYPILAASSYVTLGRVA